MTNNQFPISNEYENTKCPISDSKNLKYDLEDRTTKYGTAIIIFAKKIVENSVTRPIISQLVRSGTSVGANYCEADNAESRKDFKHKISLCKKEAKETKYWLRMIETTNPSLSGEIDGLFQEAKELNLIFSAIVNSMDKISLFNIDLKLEI